MTSYKNLSVDAREFVLQQLNERNQGRMLRADPRLAMALSPRDAFQARLHKLLLAGFRVLVGDERDCAHFEGEHGDVVQLEHVRVNEQRLIQVTRCYRLEQLFLWLNTVRKAKWIIYCPLADGEGARYVGPRFQPEDFLMALV